MAISADTPTVARIVLGFHLTHLWTKRCPDISCSPRLQQSISGTPSFYLNEIGRHDQFQRHALHRFLAL